MFKVHGAYSVGTSPPSRLVVPLPSRGRDEFDVSSRLRLLIPRFGVGPKAGGSASRTGYGTVDAGAESLMVHLKWRHPPFC